MNDGASSSRRGGCGETVLIDHGQLRSSCGYCRSSSYTSISHGLWAQSIKANDYQDLLDRGWRRSGCFLYKPEMESTCCPPYTIRLNACDFVPSREQVRVQKKMQRFVEGTLNPRKLHQFQEVGFTECNINSCNNESLAITSSGISSGKSLSGKIEKKFNEDEFLQVLANLVNNAISACIDRGDFPSIKFPTAVVKKVKFQAKRKLTEDLLYTSNIPFQIAASLKRPQSAQGKNSPSQLNNPIQNGGSLDVTPNIIAEMLSSSIKLDDTPFGLLVKACNGHLNFCSSTEHSEYSDLVSNTVACTQTFGGVRGKDKESCSTESSANIPLKKKKLEIRMKRSCFDPVEFALYKRYQIKVHGDLPDKVTESSYRRFLVDTPIIFVPPSGTKSTKSVPPCGFGSFHQQYVIDGKLVAVGVVDILPRCLSSKYLFWDPDLAFLSLGKYSALQEINWVKNSHAHHPSLQYYYLGYYIHSCNKMRYKAAYRPSELLCPLRHEWVPFDIARPLLDKKSYVVLSDFKTQHHQSSPNDTSSYPDYNGSNRTSRDEKSEAGILNEHEDIKSEAKDSGEPLRNELMLFNVGNILIDLQGSRLRFKVYGAIDKRFIKELELQLERFVGVVGNDLSGRLIYSLG
ncbi:arginyl-tRNA--protein transferase 2-like isoform X2 [Phalaenopsis equestris]|uniref:arginyl-tRNA--protein transferase 2-like isoform X2 n=1 Tax=Phalaenopsis equestris TaxID=78828 RepID=UPI0009E45B3C|nr:arginyl-tRNA--protein transferase 2-like isoform X2 [Phalaenopsis equestris]